jgi:hypothetical protein
MNTAERRWIKADNAYQYYQHYIDSKPDRYALTITDLIYVTNFKGGSAIIAEPPKSLAEKLNYYERQLRECASAPEFKRTLGSLNTKCYKLALSRIVAYANLTINRHAHIDGFRASFTSALLHFYFPRLVPILDRRGVNGARLYGIIVQPSNNQVNNLLELYPRLIAYCRTRLRASPQLTLRGLDRRLFAQPLRCPPFHIPRKGIDEGNDGKSVYD